MSKRRAAIYVIYDKDGIVDSYVTYMLQGLLQVCEKLVVVCNGILGDKGKESLHSLTKDIIIRENKGFDAWGYKAGLEYIGWGNLEQYDSVILMNDSVFGPLYPFQSMFDEMDSKNLDFWGITKHGQIPDNSGYSKTGVYPEHIQSYFYTISKSMFTHPGFIDYWTNLRDLKSWKEVVSYFEAQFTKHFAEQGFTWDVYVNTDKEFDDFSDVSQLLQLAYELVKDYKCPVIKRKSFSIEYVHFHAFGLGDSSKRAFDYIKGKVDYDTDLIWDYILRTESFRNIKDNMHLNFVLPENYIKTQGDSSVVFTSEHNRTVPLCQIALFAHLTYEDQIEYCMSYINSITEFADIYITTLTEQTKKAILERFSQIRHKKLTVKVMPPDSKGRDVGALWVALKPHMENYDYICFIHNKKSAQDKPMTVGRGFLKRCLENTLASKEYVVNIINTFADNPKLGMLFPPPVIHGPYKYLISNLWGLNYQNTVDLAKRLNIDVHIELEIDPVFPAGGMFWFRPKALKKIIDYDLKYEDFQDEPLPTDGTLGHAFERIYCFAAQSEGYYSGWVMTDNFSEAEITSLWYVLTRSQHSLWGLFKRTVVDTLRKCEGLYVFLRKIYRCLKRTMRRIGIRRG